MMDSYPNVYQEGIVENQERNLMVANIAKKMVESGRQVLVLVKMIEHGNILERMISGSFFINGSHSGKKREEHLNLMRERKSLITISTSIFDEGVDVRPLDGLIMAGGGKSQTRALQRIGRAIRPYEDKQSGYVKKDAFVVDFNDNMKFMKSHSLKRRRIYEIEPKFVIKDWK
jgi:superfamily II DNA or RNA helicase